MIKFKTDRIKDEFEKALFIKNPKLFKLLDTAAQFVELEFKKDIVLTEIYRSEEEYKALYAKAGAVPKSMPHAKWQSADLRSSIYTPREIERLLAFFNQFTFYGGQRKVAIYHAISGNVMHFHVQIGLDT